LVRLYHSHICISVVQDQPVIAVSDSAQVVSSYECSCKIV
jgi:hypothetical protein